MEGYVRHSRTHSRAPPHPSSSGTGAALYKKSYTNGGAGTGFTDYDDVFGGPPKFGVTPFTPRLEDYSEIFGSFLSSRASSIPMLGLPPVDDAVAAFDVAGYSGSEYSDVFGGFEFADFAVHYDELFERPHSGEESSDDAWTRVGTESLSEESDPSGCSERNPYFLHGEFHQSLDCNQLNVSYNKVNLGPIEDSNITYIAQLSAVPGYTYIVNGSSSLQKEDAERYSSGVADDIILCEDPSGNISVEPLWKASSILPHGYVGEQLDDYDKNAGLAPRTDNYYVNPTFVSGSDISPRAEPSHLLSPSIPSSLHVDSKEDSVSSASDYEVPKSRAAETTVDGGLLHFFDLELDAGSSAVKSAAAMKEAMDKAKVKLKNVKLMERKKDGLKGLKPGAKNEIKGEGKARADSIESSLSNDQKQKACKREQDQFMNYGKDVQDASRTSAVSFDPMRVEHVVDGVSTHVNGGFTNNQPLSLDHGSVDRDGELMEATQYCDLLNNCNTKVEPTLTHTAIKLANDKNALHFGIANGKTESAKHQEEKMEGMYVLAPENEDSKSDEEPYDPMENRRRLRTTKASSRKEFHQKMLKVAQEVHETVIGDHVETEMRLNDGGRGNAIEWNLEALPEGKLNERRFDQADQHVDSEEKHKWESDTSGIEFRTREDFAQGEYYGKTETDTCMFEGKERRTKEFYVGEETLDSVKEVQGKENGNGVNKAHEFKEIKDAFSWKEKEVQKRVVCTIDEDICFVNEALAQKEQNGLSGSTAGQDNDEGHSCDAESLKIPDDVWERAGNETKLQEVHRTEQGENNIEATTNSHLYEMKMEDSFELEENEKHELSTEDSESGGRFDAFQDEDVEKQKLMQQNKSEEAEKIYNGAPEKDLQRFKDYVQPELSSDEQNNFPGRLLNVGSEFFSPSNGPSSLDDKKIGVPEVLCQCDDLTSFDTVSSHDDKHTRPNAMACEGEKKYVAHATEHVAVDEEKGDLGRDNFIGKSKTDSKVSKMADLCTSDEHLQKTEAAQTKIAEGKASIQKRPKSSNISQRVVKEGKAVNGYLAPEEREKAETSRRDDGPKKQHIRTFDEEKEKEREREIEERVRKLEELREEQERKLEMERLKKHEEERERDRVKELDEERIWKLEEEWERERERQKDRMGLDFHACERAERVTAERITVEARHRTMAEARERLEKACAEAREKSLPDKTTVEARLRAERAAVERATAEARERALEKAKAERVTSDARVERSSSEKISTSFRDIGIRHCLSSSDLWDVDKSDGLEGESAQRCKARLERHHRTFERVAKALAEKNMRDLIAQREQAERNRLAETLDVEIKRWSRGKEGNLRALLSTLQYILEQDSGWQPISLTEVITSAAIKKAYRKATLYVHPDKLQQRGATIQQKYICEKVFDLLKDAWNRFNSEER